MHIHRLEETVEKKNSLGQTVMVQRVSRIKELPKVLLIQNMRFFWKPAEGKTAGQKAKILRKVEYPDHPRTLNVHHN